MESKEVIDVRITDVLDLFQRYAFMLDDWHIIRKNIRLLLPNELKHVISRHDEPPTHIEKQLMKRWEELSGRSIIFNTNGSPR